MKQEIMLDELIRENARLLVRQEADRLRIEELTVELEETAVPLSAEQAAEYEARLTAIQEKLDIALADLHKVMSGGDPCTVCGRKCKMGEDCKPVWHGLA